MLCSELGERLCNFWVKNNFENFFSPFPFPLPWRWCSCQKLSYCVHPCMCLLQITLLCSNPVDQVWYFNGDVANFLLHQIIKYHSTREKMVQKCCLHFWNIFFTLKNWRSNAKWKTKKVFSLFLFSHVPLLFKPGQNVWSIL